VVATLDIEFNIGSEGFTPVEMSARAQTAPIYKAKGVEVEDPMKLGTSEVTKRKKIALAARQKAHAEAKAKRAAAASSKEAREKSQAERMFEDSLEHLADLYNEEREDAQYRREMEELARGYDSFEEHEHDYD